MILSSDFMVHITQKTNNFIWKMKECFESHETMEMDGEMQIMLQ